ncbi:antibiotic biosynthesis monooxygenase [Streptacidiphilus sp. PB12-B1b]|uniref:putative quinol monooxygenase n=1 Tax=Streptacidiphilus sp. PB12-B1b TaxID=2705012 RepID=UPI0015FE3F9F|nr:antibiotic biosynthesis monooxygenase [Streptacidiphilus sp. PB12-B1b]QMU79824.1 antibiotic biosynthesis monooxygenase [Streptacidiphilus sp. PB12-B1b]
MSSGFGLVVRFELHDATAAAGFDQLVSQTAEGIKAHEPGTLIYVVHTVPDEPNVRVFYELYADRDAFDAHEQQPHTKHFLAEREQYINALQVTFLDAQAGKGPVAA